MFFGQFPRIDSSLGVVLGGSGGGSLEEGSGEKRTRKEPHALLRHSTDLRENRNQATETHTDKPETPFRGDERETGTTSDVIEMADGDSTNIYRYNSLCPSLDVNATNALSSLPRE